MTIHAQTFHIKKSKLITHNLGVGISISKKLYQGLASIYKLAMAPQDGKPITTTSATTSLQATISDLMLSCLPPRTGSGQLTKS